MKSDFASWLAFFVEFFVLSKMPSPALMISYHIFPKPHKEKKDEQHFHSNIQCCNRFGDQQA